MLHQFQLTGPPAGGLDGVLALLAPILEIHPSNRLGPPFGLGAWETSVPPGRPPEASLPPLELGGRALLHLLHVVLRVRLALRTVRPDHLGVMHRRPPSRVAYLGLFRARGRTPEGALFRWVRPRRSLGAPGRSFK